MAWTRKAEVADYQHRAALDRIKLLPGGTSFLCEAHKLVCEKASLDYHHKIPQEAGGSDDPENVAALCVNCHQLLHRVALMLISSKAHKQTPLDVVTQYAKRINAEHADDVISSMLMFAQLVAAYKVQKADLAIAPPDGVITAAEMPNEFKVVFKQIAWEVKRGDGRGLGMANLTAVAILHLVATHRPELKQKIDIWLHDNIFYPVEKAKEVWQAMDEFEDTTL